MQKAIYLEVLEKETGRLIRAVHPYAGEKMFLRPGNYSVEDFALRATMTRFVDGHTVMDVIRTPPSVFSKRYKGYIGSVEHRTYGVAAKILNLPSDVGNKCLKTMIEFENLARTNESRWVASEMMGLGTESYEKIGDKIDKVLEENGRSVDDLTTFLYGGKQHFAG